MGRVATNTYGIAARFGNFVVALASVCVAAAFSAATARAQQFGPWSTPTNLGSTVNSACNDMHPTLSKDGLTLIFSSTRPADSTEWFNSAACAAPVQLRLWVSHFNTNTNQWGTPRPLKTLLAFPNEDIYGPDNQYGEDHAPYLTTDGHWLFFHSQRAGGCNGGVYRELWAAHREDTSSDAWEAPINLGCTLNTPGNENAGPNFWEDEATGILYLYLARDLQRNGPGADSAGNGIDVYISTCTADLSSCIREQLWSPATKVDALDSSVRDTRTAIRRRDGLEMNVTSGRCNSPIPAADSAVCAGSVSAGALDMWVATRPFVDPTGLIWTFPPVNLNDDNLARCALVGIDAASCPVVNTTSNDAAPAISWDGQTLIFWSNRPGGFGGNDLYISTRQRICDATTNPSCTGSQ